MPMDCLSVCLSVPHLAPVVGRPSAGRDGHTAQSEGSEPAQAHLLYHLHMQSRVQLIHFWQMIIQTLH
jgi:hypothetical protein